MSEKHLCRLDNRGVVRIGGEDRRVFLQGLISNDVYLCTPDHAIYAALLTPQGKFLHDLFIVDAGDHFLIDCEAARANDLMALLKKYKLRAKVTLDAAPDLEVFAEFQNSNGMPASAGMTSKLDTALKPERHSREGGNSIFLYADPRLPELGTRFIVTNGAMNADSEFSAYDKHRLKLGVPDGSRDMLVEKSTLLECNIDKLNGISWTKGCYMGQELTARMHYRGLVKKRLFSVNISDSGPAPAFGAVIHLGNEEIGEMRSSYGNTGLALLSIEKTKDVVELNCGDTKLTSYVPYWMKI